LYGITSHGLQRLSMYVNGLKIGRIKIEAVPKVVQETPVSAVIDAQDSMGQVAGVLSMELAIKKARSSGIGFVVTRNNNHFGIAGYYTRMAMQQNLLGICMTNSEALQVPTFGKRAMLGSNPIAVAMPAEPFPFMLDIATAVVPRGKLEVYMKDEKPIPAGWGVGSDGKVSTDPFVVNDCFAKKTPGGILPLGGLGEVLGGHKGYGVALLVELFTGVLAQGYTSDLVRKVPSIDRSCATFIAVDYGMFGDKKTIEKGFSDYLQKLRDSDKADGETHIYTHGEKEILRTRECDNSGIAVQQKTIDEIVAISERLGIDYKRYLVLK
jgi:L-2-hydroxycarboxylate dehydrogenase (NAD+)